MTRRQHAVSGEEPSVVKRTPVRKLNPVSPYRKRAQSRRVAASARLRLFLTSPTKKPAPQRLFENHIPSPRVPNKSVTHQLLNRRLGLGGSARKLFSLECGLPFTKMKHQDAIKLLPEQPVVPVEMTFRAGVSAMRVVEIVLAQEFVFGLTYSGICAVFNRHTKRRIGFLNSPRVDQIVRSLFFNKATASIVTVSVFERDRFSVLRCHSVPIAMIRNEQFHSAMPLFETENLSWPGFVEFDEVNQKILTYSSPSDGSPNTARVYKVWSMADYRVLYSLSDPGIAEIKISPRLVLVTFDRSKNILPIKILDIKSGAMVSESAVLLKQNAKVEFIELFDEKMLVKQEGECLRILNLLSQTWTQIPEFPTPSSFVFLFEKRAFLTLRDRKVSAWNLDAAPLTSFDDHNLCGTGKTNTNVVISKAQDILISFCKNEASLLGYLNISSLPHGHAITTITAAAVPTSHVPVGTEHPLAAVSAICYDEESREILTGTPRGLINIWAA